MLVQYGMWELIFERIIIKEMLNSPGNNRCLQYLIDVKSPMHIESEHLIYEGLQLSTEVGRDGWVLAFAYFHAEEVDVAAVEGGLQGTELVEHDT